MKLPKELLFLENYLKAVQDIVPLERILSIKLYKYRECFPEHFALIERQGNNKSFKIILRVYQPAKNRKMLDPLDQYAVLNHLAHELSHILIWEEDEPERVYLEAKIFMRFARLLRRRGYEQTRTKTN